MGRVLPRIRCVRRVGVVGLGLAQDRYIMAFFTKLYQRLC